MSKTMKKVLVFILALIIVVLAIFAIEIKLPHERAGNGGSVSPSASNPVSPSQTVIPTATPSLSPSPSPTSLPSPSPSEYPKITREATSGGALYTVTVPGNLVTYQVTVDDSIFRNGYDDDGVVFKSIKDESEYLRISFIKDAKSSKTAPSVLNKYLNYNEFEQSGKNFIDGTKIPGETVTANDGTTEMTAWLVDTDSGVMSIIISYKMSEKAAQLPQLDKILATLTIKR